jgi:hypothetical protein
MFDFNWFSCIIWLAELRYMDTYKFVGRNDDRNRNKLHVDWFSGWNNVYCVCNKRLNMYFFNFSFNSD